MFHTFQADSGYLKHSITRRKCFGIMLTTLLGYQRELVPNTKGETQRDNALDNYDVMTRPISQNGVM